MTELTFENVSKSFATPRGRRPVLSGLSLSLKPGEVVALVGRSGCGKSTLLNLAAGLSQPDSGQVRLHEGARLGYVFQDPRLLPWLTIEGNLKLVSQPAQHTRISFWLARVGLAGRERDYPGQLSLGMAQRASLARALLTEPDVLLLDEPFGALDELTATELRAELAQLLQETGKTALLVTHNPAEAVLLADRVVVLSGAPATVSGTLHVTREFPRPRGEGDPKRFTLAQELLRILDGAV